MKKETWLFLSGLAVCLLLAFLLAPSAEDGLVRFWQRLAGGTLQKPGPSRAAPVFMLVLASVYAFTWGILKEETGHFRQGEEHGSAAWADPAAVAKKYAAGDASNKILTQHVKIGLDPVRHRRNLNTIVCGGSGAGKTRYFCIPNIIQDAGCSLFLLDPKGELLQSTGAFLCGRGYTVRVLDLIDMDRSHCYNPFRYLKSENDVQKLVTNLFRSTQPPGTKSSDPFWDTAAQMLLLALIFYLLEEAPPEDRNFACVMELLRSGMKTPEGARRSALDLLFAELEQKDREHTALKYYRSYRAGSEKTLKSIQITLASRLEKFNLDSLARLTRADDMHLEEMGMKKTAIFACVPDNDSSFNFLVSLMYTQLFQQLFYLADHSPGGKLPVPVHFLMDEFANIPVPSEFEKILSVMRSRGIFVSIILQNMAQLKALFEKQWESIVGNCDELLFLGGNEKETHRYLSEMLGKETLDVLSRQKSGTRGGSVSYSTIARELLTGDEIRTLPDDQALLFIRGERPVRDRKFDLMKHPNVCLIPQGGADGETFGEILHEAARIAKTDHRAPRMPYEETFYEVVSGEEIEEEESE